MIYTVVTIRLGDSDVRICQKVIILSQITITFYVWFEFLWIRRYYALKNTSWHGFTNFQTNFLSRRLARLRKVLKIVQGERKKFTKKEVTSELLQQAVTVNNEISSEAKHLQGENIEFASEILGIFWPLAFSNKNQFTFMIKRTFFEIWFFK